MSAYIALKNILLLSTVTESGKTLCLVGDFMGLCYLKADFQQCRDNGHRLAGSISCGNHPPKNPGGGGKEPECLCCYTTLPPGTGIA